VNPSVFPKERFVKTERVRRAIVGAMSVTLLTGLGGCGGGGAKVESQIQTTTTGQQLLDLKKAYEAGALSKEEYERERKKVLKQD
jgi:hypothetical protein